MDQSLQPAVAQVPVTRNENRWSEVLGQTFFVLWRNKKSRVGLIMLAVCTFVAIFAPWLVPYSPSDSNFMMIQPPSPNHLLGTTQNGEDVLSQLIYGTRVSLVITLATGAMSTVLSMLIGITAGYVRGIVDDILSFFTNVFLVLPGLPLLIVLASYSPAKGMLIIVLIIGLTSWPWGARVLRSQVVTLRTRDFVVGAALAGDGMGRILLREVLPNMMSLVAANFLGASLAGLLAAVGLEYLGFGDPSTISWGSMLYWANNSGALLNGQWP